MSLIGSVQPDVVRIKVYKPNSNTHDEEHEAGISKKFCIDPRLTTYQTLQCLIAQAFDIKSDFIILAIHRCPTTGRDQVQAIWSDWDLDASIQTVQPDSYLRLRYELTNRDDGLDEWDFIGLNDFNANIRWFNVDSRSIRDTVNHTAGKAASAFNKAITWMYRGNDRRNLKPVGDGDMKRFLDNDGRLINGNELRQAIYDAGIEPSYRKIVWRHLLNIFPLNMTGLERIDYLKCIDIKYKTLKTRWTDEQHQNENTLSIMRMIEKDVSRTDRAHGFYSASGDGYINVQSLLHILTTYCICHPNITYCQGMNDYASIILYIMREESLAYICFCSIMKRIRGNFAKDGVVMATKFHRLKVLLRAIDPDYWNFLESCDAVNLYFTYRWLLLECKREFPFNDALRVLEVMWATLPIDSEPPQLSEVSLIVSPSDTMIAGSSSSISTRLAQRRARSCPQLIMLDQSTYKRRSSSLIYYNTERFQSFARTQQRSSQSECQDTDTNEFKCKRRGSQEKSMEKSLSSNEFSEFDFDHIPSCANNNSSTNTPTTSPGFSTNNWLQRLSPDDMIWLEEEKNVFLHFLCVSILLAHRNFLLKQENLDEQEISVHFDRYRRRHNAEKILACARLFYGQYLQWIRKKRTYDDLSRYSGS